MTFHLSQIILTHKIDIVVYGHLNFITKTMTSSVSKHLKVGALLDLLQMTLSLIKRSLELLFKLIKD